MPKGDSPQKAQAYYHYLQSHQLVPHGRDSVAQHWAQRRYQPGVVD